jgi:hypothetical protein
MRLRILGILRHPLIILGWATSIAALTLWAIFLGYLLPKNVTGGGFLSAVVNASIVPLATFFLGSFGICAFAAVVISDTNRTILSFFPSFVGAWIITYFVLILPDLLGCCFGALELSAVSFTLVAFFPYVFFVDLAGTLVGMGISGMIE